tara:strand:- start:1172 stop:1825 length:654 start_codon:yes stop_codon:yes gene_type:complete
MCDPVSGTMAVLSIAGAYQAQAAADQQAQAQNDAYEQNQALQNEAYTKDMEVFWNKEVDIKLQGFKNAEEATDAKLDAQIEAQEAFSSMRMANMEMGSGKSGLRSMGVLRRQMANRTMDIDDQLANAQFGLSRDVESLQYDKIARRNSARGQINSVSRAEYTDSATRKLNLITSGLGGASKGRSMYNKLGKTPQPGKTPLSSQSGATTKYNLINDIR